MDKSNTYSIFLVIILLKILVIYETTYTQNKSILTKPHKQLSDSSKIKFGVLDSIKIYGNKKTKRKIILRELSIKIGDTLIFSDIEKIIERNKNNLLRHKLFNYVTIEYTIYNRNRILIKIIVEERWYLWPYLSVKHTDRNFSSWIKNKDYSRINYSFSLKKNNFRGRNEYVKLSLTSGYSKRLTLWYKDIFIGKKMKNTMGFNVTNSMHNSVDYNSNENIVKTFKADNQYIVNKSSALTIYTYHNSLYSNHNIVLLYTKINVSDTVVKLNENYLGDSKNKIQYFAIKYEFRKDYRDSRSYPLKGYFLKLYLKKRGFGIFNKNTIDIYESYVEFKKYTPLHKRFYFAGELALKSYFNDKVPYYLQDALGYKKYLRGYEYNVIDGQGFASLKSNLKFQLIPTQIFKLSFIPLKKFNKIHFTSFLNIHLDIGYVYDNYNLYKINNNYMVNTLLYGFGLGLDLITYYDKVLRIEYSYNKYLKGGLYLQFKASI